MGTLGKILTITLAGLSLIACSGKIEEPKKDYFQKSMVETANTHLGSTLFLDVNRDRKVDGISYNDVASPFLYANKTLRSSDDQRVKDKIYEEITRDMTPEIQDVTNRIFKGIQDFNYELARQKFLKAKKREK